MGAEKLLAGYRRFYSSHPDATQHFQRLAREGQFPDTMIIGCSDSRVDPSILFDTAPGEVFLMRNVANLVPAYSTDGRYCATGAAIEFATCGLQVENIIVLGHSDCGGIRFLVDDAVSKSSNLSFVKDWMQIAGQVKQETADITDMEERRRCSERNAIGLSLKNLLTFPWIAERVANDKLSIFGWYFDIESRSLFSRSIDRTDFLLINTKEGDT